MGVLCLSLFCFVLLCVLHLEDEERAGCFAFIVLQMSCYCKYHVTLPHGAVGWSALFDLGYFLIILTYLFKRSSANLNELGKAPTL